MPMLAQGLAFALQHSLGVVLGSNPNLPLGLDVSGRVPGSTAWLETWWRSIDKAQLTGTMLKGLRTTLAEGGTSAKSCQPTF